MCWLGDVHHVWLALSSQAFRGLQDIGNDEVSSSSYIRAAAFRLGLGAPAALSGQVLASQATSPKCPGPWRRGVQESALIEPAGWGQLPPALLPVFSGNGVPLLFPFILGSPPAQCPNTPCGWVHRRLSLQGVLSRAGPCLLAMPWRGLAGLGTLHFYDIAELCPRGRSLLPAPSPPASVASDWEMGLIFP